MNRKIVFTTLFALTILIVGASGGSAQENTTQAPLWTSFLYQGLLKDNDTPANGSFDFQFILYDAATGGSQVGTTVSIADVPVSDGYFIVQLDFGVGSFNGQARWLDVGVRPGGSTGSYTLLSPRQPLAAAPYAMYSLAAPWSGLVGVPAGFADGADDNTTYTAGAGLNLYGGQFSVSFAGSGVATSAARSDHNHLGQTWTGSDNALKIGGSFNTEDNPAPIVLNNTSANGLAVDSAGWNGLAVKGAGNAGLYVGSAGTDGVFVGYAGVPSTYTVSNSKNGFEIAGAQGYGLYVGQADLDGVYVNSAYWHGLNVAGARVNGIYVTGAGNHGISAFGTNLAGYFNGNIQVTGACTGCSLAAFGVNTSQNTLEPGDIVTILGTQPSGTDSAPVVWEVAPASSGQAVVGVVQGLAELITEETKRPEEIGKTMVPREGPAAPGEYVTLIIYGPAQVKVGGAVAVGDRLAAGELGSARALKTTEVNGLQVAENAPTIGIALDTPDASGLVWVLVNPQ